MKAHPGAVKAVVAEVEVEVEVEVAAAEAEAAASKSVVEAATLVEQAVQVPGGSQWCWPAM